MTIDEAVTARLVGMLMLYAIGGTIVWWRWRARPVLLAGGLVCLGVATVDVWLTSPTGRRWLQGGGVLFGLPAEPPVYVVTGLFWLFFVGWALIGASVGRLRWAVAVYLILGAITVVGPEVSNWLTAHTLLSVSVLRLRMIGPIWPAEWLIVFDIFGHRLGGLTG